MPNWIQLIEHTSEFTPGPWTQETSSENGSGHVSIMFRDAFGKLRELGVVNATASERLDGTSYENRWTDEERDANVALVICAPDMLRLLAELVGLIDHLGTVGAVPGRSTYHAYQDAVKLLASHVRIGYEPPTERETAARGDPPPPPSPPTILDIVGE